jgi:predicted acetyltransferase
MSDVVSLERARASDAPLLANLLELYVHDLSVFFEGVELGADGRFGYEKLPLYFAEPERRFAYLIRHDERVVGFALATRGSPVTEDPEVLDVAEFFVARAHRRHGVGARAALLLWRALPGRWTVRVAAANLGALEFWRGAVAELSQGTAEEEKHADAHGDWRVFRFTA